MIPPSAPVVAIGKADFVYVSFVPDAEIAEIKVPDPLEARVSNLVASAAVALVTSFEIEVEREDSAPVALVTSEAKALLAFEAYEASAAVALVISFEIAVLSVFSAPVALVISFVIEVEREASAAVALVTSEAKALLAFEAYEASAAVALVTSFVIEVEREASAAVALVTSFEIEVERLLSAPVALVTSEAKALLAFEA